MRSISLASLLCWLLLLFLLLLCTVCVFVRACVRAQGKKSHRWHQSSGKKEGGKKESTEICSSDFFRDLVSLEEDERETKQTKTRRKLMGSKNRLKGNNESNLLMPSDAV